MLSIVPILILLIGALLIALLSARARPALPGLGAMACCALSLGALLAAYQSGASAAVPWLVSGGRTLEILVASGDGLMLGSLLLLCGMATAGTMAGSAGITRAYGELHCGLLVLLAGGLLVITGLPAVASLLGLGLAWLGGLIMQLAGSRDTQRFRAGGLAIVALATALLALGAAPQLAGTPVAGVPWAAGCCVLIALGPVWGTTPAAPVLIRAPIAALGLPALGGVLLLKLVAIGTPSEALTLALLLFGVATTTIGAWNAVTATRMSDTFAWQTTALLGTLALVFGTGRPEAGPMANGLLAHTLVVGTAAALVIGLLERASGADALAALPPLPRPMVPAGLAYGLAAASAIGLPPLLGFSLRQVVLVLAQLSRPWLAPVLLAGSTLLALSYLPALVACFRRPALAMPPARAERGSGWPLLLMLGLLAGGLVPQTLWQRALGDPGAARAGVPPLASLLAASIPTLLLLLLLAAVVWLCRGRPAIPFAGGEPLDQEPGWALPFAALRNAARPAGIERFGGWLPLRAHGVDLKLHAWQRRHYLAVAVAGLLVVVWLALL